MKKAVSSNPGGTRLLAFKPTTGTPKGSESELTAFTYLEFHVLAPPVYQRRGTRCKWQRKTPAILMQSSLRMLGPCCFYAKSLGAIPPSLTIKLGSTYSSCSWSYRCGKHRRIRILWRSNLRLMYR